MAHKLTNLAAQRVAAGLTVDQLAVKSGVHACFIRRAEAGADLDVGVTAKIATALGVSLATLGKTDFAGF